MQKTVNVEKNFKNVMFLGIVSAIWMHNAYTKMNKTCFPNNEVKSIPRRIKNDVIISPAKTKYATSMLMRKLNLKLIMLMNKKTMDYKILSNPEKL